MNHLHPHFNEFAELYKNSIETIRKIETKAGISAINLKYAENLRICLEHLTTSIHNCTMEKKEPKISEDNIRKAINCLETFVQDACHAVAGKKLKQTEQLILKSRPFAGRLKAKEAYKKAKFQYTEGRNNISNPIQATIHFSNTVDLCLEAINHIEPMSNKEWVGWAIAILLLIVELLRFLKHL